MLRIGDFSKLARVSVRTLHYYDQIGLLRPAAVDGGSDYRYYDLSQLPTLHRILALKDLGLSLDQIRHVVAEQPTADDLRTILERKRAELGQSVRRARETLARVESRLAFLEDDGAAEPADVTLTATAGQPVVFQRLLVPSAHEIDAMCARAIDGLRARLRWLGVDGIRDVLLFHGDGYTAADLDIEIAVEIDPGAAAELDAVAVEPFGLRHVPDHPRVASLVFEGSCGELPEVGRRFFRWLAAAGYESIPPSREIHHQGWRRTEDPDEQVVIELQMPVAPLRLARGG
jgi:DNA-binding transcriptional MerR regulator/effector-binding domain-containing protein